MPIFRLAITGGIAEGKSTVCQHLRENGVLVESADDFAAQLLQRDSLREQIALELRLNTNWSREDLRNKLAESTAARRNLNYLLHVPILEMMSASQAYVFEVPLLVETCLHPMFREVWVVTCGPDEQIRRLTERLGERSLAERLVQAQLPTRTKIPFSSRTIRTDDSPESVKQLITQLAKGLK